MYFDAFPVIPYDAKGDLNFKDGYESKVKVKHFVIRYL